MEDVVRAFAENNQGYQAVAGFVVGVWFATLASVLSKIASSLRVRRQGRKTAHSPVRASPAPSLPLDPEIKPTKKRVHVDGTTSLIYDAPDGDGDRFVEVRSSAVPARRAQELYLCVSRDGDVASATVVRGTAAARDWVRAMAPCLKTRVIERPGT